MPEKVSSRLCGALGRLILLALLAGHLLFRREFAHHNLGELLTWLKIDAPAFASQLYVTEFALLILFPLTLVVMAGHSSRAQEPFSENALAHGAGASFFIVLAFMGWGLIHAATAYLFGTHNIYLIFRQSVLIGYAIVFLYAFVLFAPQRKYITVGLAIAVIVAVGCAAADYAGYMKASIPNPLYPDEAVFGQETLPLAILGLGLFIVYNEIWFLRGLAVFALALVCWRQSVRELQSVVPVGLAAAVAVYVLFGSALALRARQYNTIKRGALLLALFAVGFGAWRFSKKTSPEQSVEIGAWSWKIYDDLFQVYDMTEAPSDPEKQVHAANDPQNVVTDPEVYKLIAVYTLARQRSISVTNNIWRLLMWRHMLLDWRTGHPIAGAGVGKAWKYNEAFAQMPPPLAFHHETDPGGLNPHNSYLNLLYRYGLIGFVLFLLLLLSVLVAVWKALKLQPKLGDPLLEGILLYFIYTAVFAFFTVSFEGPSYSLPFWMSLGLLYARSKQILSRSEERSV